MKRTVLILLLTFAAIAQAVFAQSAISANMVFIQGGTFMMGSPETEPARDSDETQHQVTVSSFYIGKYQVTQEEYREVMGTNPSYFKGDNLPVEQVNWYDAIVYCNKLSIRENLTPAYSINGKTNPDEWGTTPTSENAVWDAVITVNGSNGYRLPTEAQWEYACRAGTTTAFNWGTNYIDSSKANYDARSANDYNTAVGTYLGRTTPVGNYAANTWGLYDMHGNVWEWCWDRYDSYQTGARTDPQGAASGGYRVRRGGCWGYGGRYLRSAYRGYDYPGYRDFDVGFRLVRPAS